jgi:tRNA (adenine57-N1/adenine58-N1)-methyltransferase catalytic subunit
MACAQAGDVIQLVGRDRNRKYHIFQLVPSGQLHTHHGVVEHDSVIGIQYGAEIRTHRGYPFLLLQPSTDDLIREIRRTSQIIYTKDSGFILMKMSIRPDMTIVEAGTGSGGMTTVLAQAVGRGGRVISYDIRPDMQNLARKNLEKVGLLDRVTLKLQDIANGFDESDVAALFLDVPNPWDYMAQVHRALSGGGFFGSIVPTTNQVSELLIAMQRENFDFVEVCEVLVRNYKPVPNRLRPVDRMVAHTAYLVFGRSVLAVASASSISMEELAEDAVPDVADGPVDTGDAE